MKDPDAIVSKKEFERLVSDKFLDRQLNALSDQELAQVRIVVLEHLPPDDPEVVGHRKFMADPRTKRAAEHYQKVASGELSIAELTADERRHVGEYAHELGLNFPPTMETKNVFDL